jgi:hypothetical protein
MAAAEAQTEDDYIDESVPRPAAKPRLDPKKPHYRLTEPAYIDDLYLEEGKVIVYEGKPGHHMSPLNELARAAHKKAFPDGVVHRDPIDALTSLR